MTGSITLPFRDRKEAGIALASELEKYWNQADVVVLGLARGGVPVAAEVARKIDAPLDVYVVRKLGTPGHEELAMGAIGTGGVRVMNDEVVRGFGIPNAVIRNEIASEEKELARQERTYRGGAEPADVKDKTAIVVDDGLATGYSMRAAVQGLRQRDPARVVVGVPVAAWESCHMLKEEADEVVCAETPRPFLAVGEWYEEFRQAGDEEVRRHLTAH